MVKWLPKKMTYHTAESNTETSRRGPPPEVDSPELGRCPKRQ